jgi:hypothetical protein
MTERVNAYTTRIYDPKPTKIPWGEYGPAWAGETIIRWVSEVSIETIQSWVQVCADKVSKLVYKIV